MLITTACALTWQTPVVLWDSPYQEATKEESVEEATKEENVRLPLSLLWLVVMAVYWLCSGCGEMLP